MAGKIAIQTYDAVSPGLQNIPLAFSTMGNSKRMPRISDLLRQARKIDSRFGSKPENKLPRIITTEEDDRETYAWKVSRNESRF
jgi:hypothetical protein